MTNRRRRASRGKLWLPFEERPPTDSVLELDLWAACRERRRLGYRMQAIAKKPGEEPEVITLETADTLKQVQQLVGGYVEECGFPLPRIMLLANEDGRDLHQPINVTMESGISIRGPMVLIGYDEAGQWRSLTQSEIDDALRWFDGLDRQDAAN